MNFLKFLLLTFLFFRSSSSCDEAESKAALRFEHDDQASAMVKFLAAKQCNSNECYGNFTPTRLFI
jgi:hypothetical protein